MHTLISMSKIFFLRFNFYSLICRPLLTLAMKIINKLQHLKVDCTILLQDFRNMYIFNKFFIKY